MSNDEVFSSCCMNVRLERFRRKLKKAERAQKRAAKKAKKKAKP